MLHSRGSTECPAKPLQLPPSQYLGADSDQFFGLVPLPSETEVRKLLHDNELIEHALRPQIGERDPIVAPLQSQQRRCEGSIALAHRVGSIGRERTCVPTQTGHQYVRAVADPQYLVQ